MNPGLSAFAAASQGVGARLDLARAGIDRAAKDAAPGSGRARETAAEFESMMLEEMLGRVFESVGDVGFFGEAGPGAGMYRSMLVKEYAGMIAKSGGVGFADQVYAEILKLQEAS
jgi:flagellar protein FlgJ